MKKKLQYIWDYYKWYFIIPIIVLFFAFSIISSFIENNKPKDISIAFVNANENLVEQIEDIFDGKDILIYDDFFQSQTQSLDTDSVANIQKFSALLTNGGFDVAFSPDYSVEMFEKNNAYVNLEEFLPDELYKSVSKDLFFCENSEGENIPVGIVIEQNQILTVSNYAKNTDYIIYLIENLKER